MARQPKDLKATLALVRRYTGDRFGAAKGYDLRKPLSKARQKTIGKYADMIRELTSGPHAVIDPPKGGKREAFEFTGQRHHPKFTKAIVRLPDPDAKYDFSLDRSRPKGSRFTMTNRVTRERSWHIPADVFLYEDPELYDEGDEPDGSFFQDVIEEYGEDGEVYLIEAGDYHMWGSAGTPESVGQKLAELFKSYGAGNFDATNRNSHFIGNWFRGVQVYSDARDVSPYLAERVAAHAKRMRERGTENPWTKFRQLKSGDIGVFERGKLAQVIKSETIKPLKKTRRRG